MRTRTLAALSAAVMGVSLVAASVVLPASADNHTPLPIAVEPLTPRSTFTDDVSIQFKMKTEGHGTEVVNLKDPSRVVTTRITVQPGARFPLHTHPGPVVVTVADGELTYVDPDGCIERVYPAGTAFLDSGDDVHTAFASSDDVTILIATFLAVPAEGPLTIPEAVQDPTICP